MIAVSEASFKHRYWVLFDFWFVWPDRDGCNSLLGLGGGVLSIKKNTEKFLKVVIRGPLALPGRVWWIWVHLSFRPSFPLSGSFLGIDPLVFSEIWRGIVHLVRTQNFLKNISHLLIRTRMWAYHRVKKS